MKKRKRLNQLAAQEKEKNSQHAGGVLGVNDCDLGASPQMSKGSMFAKHSQPTGKHSPLMKASPLMKSSKDGFLNR